MIFSWQWLNKLVDLDGISVFDLKDKLSQTLAEVETVTNVGENYEGILLAQVKSISKHPKADKLVIVQVNDGKGEKQVVTSASNMQEGDWVIYIPPGVKVPYNAYPGKFDGIVQKMNLRGVDSEGMLASAKEIKFGNDHSGLFIVPVKEFLLEDLQAGKSIINLFSLDDYIVEIENKALTHRGDVFSIHGIAREVAATFNRSLKLPKYALEDPSIDSLKIENKVSLGVKIEATKSCSRYTAQVLRNINLGDSPIWLKSILARYGVSIINSVVDVTNYIMLEMGQPLHAFDYDKLVSIVGENPSMGVRQARLKEKILTLDNKEHALHEDITVITAEDHPVAIAGIIGGQETAIDENTKSIVLESATFEMYAIRKASMKLGIITDASSVFSRFQDPNKNIRGLDRAVKLLQKEDFAAAQLASAKIDNYPVPRQVKKIEVDFAKLKSFIGVDLSFVDVKKNLQRLALDPQVSSKNEVMNITIPTFRNDLNIVEDVYEEVARLYGLNNIPAITPQSSMQLPVHNKLWEFKQFLRHTLVREGLYETVNFNFISEKVYSQSNLSTDHCYKITNAISPEVQFMRSLLLPSLLLKTQQNLRYQDNFALFEINKTHRRDLTYQLLKNQSILYTPAKEFADTDNLPVEDQHLAMVWANEQKNFTGAMYYLGKQYIDKLVSLLHINEVEYNHIGEFSKKARIQFPLWLNTIYPTFHPRRTAIVTANVEDKNIYLGIMGELNPLVRQKMNLPEAVMGAEFGFHILAEYSHLEVDIVPPSKYPIVQQDLCFVVSETVSYESLIKALLKDKHDLIQHIEPIDIYNSVEDKKHKQITVRITLQSKRKTLTSADIFHVRKQVIAQVKADVQGIEK